MDTPLVVHFSPVVATLLRSHRATWLGPLAELDLGFVGAGARFVDAILASPLFGRIEVLRAAAMNLEMQIAMKLEMQIATKLEMLKTLGHRRSVTRMGPRYAPGWRWELSADASHHLVHLRGELGVAGPRPSRFRIAVGSLGAGASGDPPGLRVGAERPSTSQTWSSGSSDGRSYLTVSSSCRHHAVCRMRS